MTNLPISLVIPIRDEENSIENLIESIAGQTCQPDEVIFVDGGSKDGTVGIVNRLAAKNGQFKLIECGNATPGKGRNIGTQASRNEWIAFTDAGIWPEADWLERLWEAAGTPGPKTEIRPGPNTGPVEIVYGNYRPEINCLFEKCATIAYAPPQRPGAIRGKSIASSMLRKAVWENVGGFPDMRAAEDLMFMEAAEAAGFQVAFEPKAMVHWQLRPDVASTFLKFVLYSKHNVWAGRQWDWHHGIARQYLLLLPFAVLVLFHSLWWLVGIPLWLFARTAKRILSHRFEFGTATLFNPAVFLGVAGLILVIDLATFIGWAQAIYTSPPAREATLPRQAG